MTYAKTNDRFANLNFEGFRQLAQDPTLTPHERVGFPDSYRAGKEGDIFADILRKLPNLSRTQQTVVDIGIGCSGVASRMIELCRAQQHRLYAVDSSEMLTHLPDNEAIVKLPTYFPTECRDWIGRQAGKVDVLLCYSVFHYVFAEGNPYDFLDAVCTLLAPGGECLIGDIPNQSQRKRFFSSAAGIAFHRAFMGTDDLPPVTFNRLEPGQIDDAVLASIVLRCRAAGFHAYWLPQDRSLPMENRREDLVIRRP